MIVMEQEQIISYLQIVHQLWVDGWLDIDEAASYIDETDYNFSIIDPKTKSIKAAYKFDWLPTVIHINSKGKITVSTEDENL